MEHTSTHVDSPAHFVENAETIDAVPLERFTGTWVVVDVQDLPQRAEIGVGVLEERLAGVLDELGPG
ncbi:cyclase family protein [Infirmifilum lucidum]|uniref:Cyclase family protein n=1 Tax=Infirmifilum lucidum TaxID=2776706 RepID=A0A7L9FIU8_9CREN|nr:cyclase family protein [Infirmifilum lucidum]QOJ78844.1 cyclase family protein [Infirmifilum lucidum]